MAVTFTEEELLTQLQEDFEGQLSAVDSEQLGVQTLPDIFKLLNNMHLRQKGMFGMLQMIKKELNTSRLHVEKCAEILERVFDKGPHEESQSLLANYHPPIPIPVAQQQGIEFVSIEFDGSIKKLILSPAAHSKILSTDCLRTVVREILLSLHHPEFLVKCTLTGERKRRKTQQLSLAKRPNASFEENGQLTESQQSGFDTAESESFLEAHATHALPHDSFELILAACEKKFPLGTDDAITTKRRKKDVREAITQSLQYLKGKQQDFQN